MIINVHAIPICIYTKQYKIVKIRAVSILVSICHTIYNNVLYLLYIRRWSLLQTSCGANNIARALCGGRLKIYTNQLGLDSTLNVIYTCQSIPFKMSGKKTRACCYAKLFINAMQLKTIFNHCANIPHNIELLISMHIGFCVFLIVDKLRFKIKV